jgi:hypothetical protein
MTARGSGADGGFLMKRLSAIFSIGLVMATATPAMAQRRGPKHDSKKGEIPAESRPPKGMCRIWIDDVPAAQQPATTDCASAIKNRPANARVIFGDDYADTSDKKRKEEGPLPPDVKGFAGVKRPAPPILPKRPPKQ